MSEVFEYRTEIIERDLDTFGHVNNSVYLQLYEAARWDFITKGGFGLKTVQADRQGPVLLELHLNFKRELLNRQKILITSQFRGMKNKLVMLLRQEIIKQESNKLASSVDIILGFMDLKKRKLIYPTPKWLQALGLSEDEIKQITSEDERYC